VREAAGGSCRRWRMRPCSAQGTPCRSSSPQHACTTRRGPHHHRRSHTSLPAPLEGDLPSFPARSTSACVAPGLVHARGASSVEASGVHALRRRRTALSCRHRGRGRCGEVAEAGDSDCVDAPVERALVDGRLDAMRQ
jgi:hypothetical protein